MDYSLFFSPCLSSCEKRHNDGGNVIIINKVKEEKQIATVVNATEICLNSELRESSGTC